MLIRKLIYLLPQPLPLWMTCSMEFSMNLLLTTWINF